MTAVSPETLEAQLRAIGRERYHGLHPFHRALHDGVLDRGQVQAWALNRFFYQAAVPRKDAALMSRIHDPDLRRAWRQRLVDHDGTTGEAGAGERDEDAGGLSRWLDLAEATGLGRRAVAMHRGVLPATRFAVQAYVAFVRERSLLEAIASSLTELFSPGLIAERMKGLLASYPFFDRRSLAYFVERLEQAPRDSGFALDWVLSRARDEHTQELVRQALIFKCDVLWAQLDALHYAYVDPGLVPPGCFRPAAGGDPPEAP